MECPVPLNQLILPPTPSRTGAWAEGTFGPDLCAGTEARLEKVNK